MCVWVLKSRTETVIQLIGRGQPIVQHLWYITTNHILVLARSANVWVDYLWYTQKSRQQYN